MLTVKERKITHKKVNTDKYAVSLQVCICDDPAEITIHIIQHNKVTRNTIGVEYDAEDYPAALAKYKEVVQAFEKKYK